jgi:hypothetical protein
MCQSCLNAPHPGFMSNFEPEVHCWAPFPEFLLQATIGPLELPYVTMILLCVHPAYDAKLLPACLARCIWLFCDGITRHLLISIFASGVLTLRAAGNRRERGQSWGQGTGQRHYSG